MFRHYYIKLLKLGTDNALKNKFKLLRGASFLSAPPGDPHDYANSAQY